MDRLRRRAMSALRLLALVALLALPALTPELARAAAGDLDPSFDGDGKRFLPQMLLASEVLVQEDGKIVLVGTGGPANAYDFVLTRLNADGSLDRGFDGDGVAVADFGNDERSHAAALQPDGRIVVAGQSRSVTANTLAVARFDPDGKLDATFDPGGADGDGKKLVPFPPGQPGQSDAAAVLVQPDGRIVLAGEGFSDTQDMAVTRLTPSGAVDGDGVALADFGDDERAEAAALTPDGKIVATGEHFPPGGLSEIALARFGSDGKLDETFSGDGKVTLASAGDEFARAVVVQPDGRIVAAGASKAPGLATMVATRFNPDGTPDQSWDGDGRAFADFGRLSAAYAVALQPDGKVLAAGAAGTLTAFDMAIARYQPNGSLDASFGSAGLATVDFGFLESAAAIALQRDGRVIIAGGPGVEGASAPVARLLADPPPASGGAGGGPADHSAPQLTGLRLTPRRFARGNRSPRLQAGRAKRRGAQIRFTLSEPARVRFSFQRARRGRFRAVRASFAVDAPAGAVRVRFQGRLTGRRRLAPGRYRLIATPVDGAGNTGRARRTAFRLLAAAVPRREDRRPSRLGGFEQVDVRTRGEAGAARGRGRVGARQRPHAAVLAST